jgi:hypothetical protein
MKAVAHTFEDITQKTLKSSTIMQERTKTPSIVRSGSRCAPDTSMPGWENALSEKHSELINAGYLRLLLAVFLLTKPKALHSFVKTCRPV